METMDKIIMLIKEKGLEQQELANAIGVPKNTISEWKSGKTKSYLKYVDKIAQFLGVTTDYLLNKDAVITIQGIDNSQNIIGQANAPITISNGGKTLSKQEEALLRIFNSVDDKTQYRIMSFMYNIEEEYEKKNKIDT